MHAEVQEFLVRTHELGWVDWADADVLEIGALNSNGSARDWVPATRSWYGIDLVQGPGVDEVADAATWLPEHPAAYSAVVSTEVLEHTPVWATIVTGAVQALRPGGYLVMTCAGDGRPPHGAWGAAGLQPGEYYCNVGLPELLDVLARLDVHVVHSEAGPPGDTRVVAQRLPIG